VVEKYGGIITIQNVENVKKLMSNINKDRASEKAKEAYFAQIEKLNEDIEKEMCKPQKKLKGINDMVWQEAEK
jgi:methionine salvage enolase-phosphatase E1